MGWDSERGEQSQGFQWPVQTHPERWAGLTKPFVWQLYATSKKILRSFQLVALWDTLMWRPACMELFSKAFGLGPSYSKEGYLPITLSRHLTTRLLTYYHIPIYLFPTYIKALIYRTVLSLFRLYRRLCAREVAASHIIYLWDLTVASSDFIHPFRAPHQGSFHSCCIV